jgi:LacI family transcriptional regulator
MDSKRILVVTFVELQHGREMYRGVWDYVHARHLHWRPMLVPLEKAPRDLRRIGRADGAVAVMHDRAIAAEVMACTRRVVSLSTWDGRPRLPIVRSDDVAIGRVAAEHLVGLGFRRFAVQANPAVEASAERAAGFIVAVREAGWQEIYLHAALRPELPEGLLRGTGRFGGVRELPRLTAVFAGTCYVGQELILDCEAAGRPVPDDIAVIAAGEDDLMAQTAWPPFSTLDINPRQVGYRAAARLEERLNGRRKADVHLVPPGRVISRQSTNVVAVEDGVVGAALQYIARHFPEGITVDDVASAVSINRRTLEQRFAKALHRSPYRCIAAARLERAGELLRTSMTTGQVARAVGYSSPSHLATAFRKQTGLTPGQWRRRHRT